MTGVRESILAALRASGLDAVPRETDAAGWGTAWSALAYQPVACAEPMLDYQHTYLRSGGWTLTDASLVLRNDNRPCGLWPLTLGGPEGATRLTSTAAAIRAPALVGGLSPRTVKKICTRALAFMHALCKTNGVPGMVVEQGAEPGSAAEGAAEWHQQLMAAGATVTVRHDLYTDLRPELADIRSGFRKSFRPLINAGLRNWSVFVLDQATHDPAAWAEFKQLHRDVAGRSTRNDATWAAQAAMISAGSAFLVGLRDASTRRLVGAGFFQCTRDEGFYSVGVYDRSLFDKPLGHVVQQIAIETMKARGLRWYRIGERFHSQDPSAPSDKEVAISAFKQGFASHMYARHEFSLVTSDPTEEKAST